MKCLPQATHDSVVGVKVCGEGSLPRDLEGPVGHLTPIDYAGVSHLLGYPLRLILEQLVGTFAGIIFRIACVESLPSFVLYPVEAKGLSPSSHYRHLLLNPGVDVVNESVLEQLSALHVQVSRHGGSIIPLLEELIRSHQES